MMDPHLQSAYQAVVCNPLIMDQVLKHLNRNDYRNLRLVDYKWLGVVKKKFAANETIYIDGAHNLQEFLEMIDSNDDRIESFQSFNLSADILLDLQFQQNPPGLSTVRGFRTIYENILTKIRCSFDWRRVEAFDGLLEYLQVFTNLNTLSLFVHRGWERSPLVEKCRDFKYMDNEEDDYEEEFENQETPTFSTLYTIRSIKNFFVESHSGHIPNALMEAFFKAFPMMSYFKLNADRQALIMATQLIQNRPEYHQLQLIVEYQRYLSLNQDAITVHEGDPPDHFYVGGHWIETPEPLPIENVRILNLSKIKIWISYPIDALLIPSLTQHLLHHSNHLKQLEIRMDVTAHAFIYPEYQFPDVLPNIEDLSLIVNFEMTEEEYIEGFREAISVRFDPFPEMNFAVLFPNIKSITFECRFQGHDQEEREIIRRYANKLFGLLHNENSMTLTDLKSNLFDGFGEDPDIVTLDVLYAIKCAFPALQYVHPCDGTEKLEWKKAIELYAVVSDFCMSI